MGSGKSALVARVDHYGMSRDKKHGAVLTHNTPSTARRPTGGVAWQARVDGVEQPLVVVANDILQAAALFTQQLGSDALKRADIYAVSML